MGGFLLVIHWYFIIIIIINGVAILESSPKNRIVGGTEVHEDRRRESLPDREMTQFANVVPRSKFKEVYGKLMLGLLEGK